VGVLYNPATDIYGYSGYFDGNIVVSFRGSEFGENWILDIDFTQVQYHDDIPGALVHSGFYQAYLSVQADVRASVLKMLSSTCKGCNVTTTGHSLGAAVAGHCAVDLAIYLNEQLKMNVSVGTRTFGQPRLGNKVFAQLGNGFLMRNERMTHRHDDVPHLPPQDLFGYMYHHMAQELWNAPDPQNNDSVIMFCDYSGEDPSCSDTVPVYRYWPSDHMYYWGIHNTNCH